MTSTSPAVMDHYTAPRNVGSLDKNDPDVGTGIAEAPTRGDMLKLQIRVNPGTSVIQVARFKAYGCTATIAAGSLATERVKGLTLDEAWTIRNCHIIEELGLPADKAGAVLVEEAIQAAIEDYRAKHKQD